MVVHSAGAGVAPVPVQGGGHADEEGRGGEVEMGAIKFNWKEK